MVQLEWPLDQCAFCLTPFGEGDDHPHRRTHAHVIPKSLGGNLTTTALCFMCNSRTGTKFEHSLPLDPTLRAEIERFASVVPAFARQQSKAGRRYVAKTAQGPMTMIRTKSGRWRAVDTTLEDGSRLKDTSDSVVELRGRLTKSRIDDEEIESLLGRFAEGHDVHVGDMTFRPHTADLEIDLPWDAEPANARAFLSIATHFLACVAGPGVFVEALEPVRRALAVTDELDADATWTLVSPQAPRDSAPWHRLMIVAGKPHVIVDVCLFGRWRYHVHFNRISWGRERWGVAFDLPTGALVSKNLGAEGSMD